MRYFVLAIVITVLMTFGDAAVAAPPAPTKDERCAVCGMFVAPFKQWVSVIEMNDGRRFYFDGPKDMFVAFFEPKSHLGKASIEEVAGVYVTEYYTLQMMPATAVLFVTGSNVMGPMGQELVPVAGAEAAATFQRDHAGQKLMRFDGRQLVEVDRQP